MSKELIERLLDNRVTGFNLTVAAVEAAECIEGLEQQLAAARADTLQLREALEVLSNLSPIGSQEMHIAEEALAATADLDGLILCEKKPVARKISYGSLVFLEGYAELSEGTPLYRAWEPKT